MCARLRLPVFVDEAPPRPSGTLWPDCADSGRLRATPRARRPSDRARHSYARSWSGPAAKAAGCRGPWWLRRLPGRVDSPAVLMPPDRCVSSPSDVIHWTAVGAGRPAQDRPACSPVAGAGAFGRPRTSCGTVTPQRPAVGARTFHSPPDAGHTAMDRAVPPGRLTTTPWADPMRPHTDRDHPRADQTTRLAGRATRRALREAGPDARPD